MKEALSNWLRQDLQKWLLNLARDLGSLFMFLVISVAVCAGLLYVLKALWFTYMSTPVGERFIMLFGSRADAIERLLSQTLLSLSLSISVMALKVCLVGAVVGRLFFLVRYLYEYRGLWAKALFWGLPCAGITAYITSVSYDLDWIPALVLSAICILLLLNPCIRPVQGSFQRLRPSGGPFPLSSKSNREPPALRLGQTHYLQLIKKNVESP